MLEFTCPKCGGRRLQEKSNAFHYDEINFIDEETLEFGYKPFEVKVLDTVGYECVD